MPLNEKPPEGGSSDEELGRRPGQYGRYLSETVHKLPEPGQSSAWEDWKFGCGIPLLILLLLASVAGIIWGLWDAL